MAFVAPAILAMDREDFVGRGQQLSVPCALVNTVGQFTQDPQPRSRGFFVRKPLAGLGEFDLSRASRSCPGSRCWRSTAARRPSWARMIPPRSPLSGGRRRGRRRLPAARCPSSR